jgi:hypothetical protein
MEKFSPPISKPTDFGVSHQEVTEIVTRIRDRGRSSEADSDGRRAGKHNPSAPSGGARAPRARIL